MSRSIEARLDRLLEARHEQDQQAVKATISEFLGTMTPDQLWECREPDVCRPRLADFLATQPAKVITTIERWAKAKKGAK